MTEITASTKMTVEKLFGPERSNRVEIMLLQKCGQNVPGCGAWSSLELERVWMSVLKLSGGNFEKLDSAIALANTDYRDLFMSAGFSHDLEAHLKWAP